MKKCIFLKEFLYVLPVFLFMSFLIILPVEGKEENSDLKDGIYEMEIVLEGGSGRASVRSPAKLVVKDGRAVGRVEWSSSHYDYMIVDGKKYFPVNDSGNSVFEIPVTIFGKPVKIVADTTAMSVPHEVEYTMIFSAKQEKGQKLPVLFAGVIAVLIAVVFAGIFMRKKKGES
ncbi:MAG: hypothetical protein MR867_00070 [Eubacterium sp.]|nr:hypothetical protein [Eubacterium sp.]MDD7209749.1 hypothetical protein [Lachnospiraceae bacterium]MDY5496455.1 hypothetical protein [Anaerobutyricum sp.]